MTTTSKVLYASQARPWLKYYDPNYIDQPMPECSAFDFVRQQNKNRLSETALEYYGRKFTYADLIVNTKKTAAAFRAAGVRKGDIITVVSVMTPEVIYAFYAADRIEKLPYLSLVRPKGTFYLFPGVEKTGLDEKAFCKVLLDQAHVLVSPGTPFGVSAAGHFRIACTVGIDRLKAAFDRMEKLSF